jgi:hypothetical protein
MHQISKVKKGCYITEGSDANYPYTCDSSYASRKISRITHATNKIIEQADLKSNRNNSSEATKRRKSQHRPNARIREGCGCVAADSSTNEQSKDAGDEMGSAWRPGAYIGGA